MMDAMKRCDPLVTCSMFLGQREQLDGKARLCLRAFTAHRDWEMAFAVDESATYRFMLHGWAACVAQTDFREQLSGLIPAAPRLGLTPTPVPTKPKEAAMPS